MFWKNIKLYIIYINRIQINFKMREWERELWRNEVLVSKYIKVRKSETWLDINKEKFLKRSRWENEQILLHYLANVKQSRLF